MKQPEFELVLDGLCAQLTMEAKHSIFDNAWLALGDKQARDWVPSRRLFLRTKGTKKS